MGIVKADRRLMREMNNQQVLQRIRNNGPISRPELSEQTGLGLSTISNIISELLEQGLILEIGEGESSGGRRPNLIDLNPLARFAFGVKIGPGTVWISLFDLRARQLHMEEVVFDVSDVPEVLFGQIASVILKIKKEHRIANHLILGVGVSSSGIIDPSSGTCIYSPILNWTNVPIKEVLSQLTKLHISVENDVNAYSYGMLLRETDSSVTNMICITTGPGVGAGIILDRKLYRGSRGGAGEFGHISIDRNGPQCACGRKGCMEVMASDQFLLSRARQLLKTNGSPVLEKINDENKLSAKSLYYAAQLGDMETRSIFKELGENMGSGIADLINLFNPDKIVIGGEGVIASEFFMESLRAVAIQSSFPHLADHLDIVVDDGSEDIWLQGAATLVIDGFFNNLLVGTGGK